LWGESTINFSFPFSPCHPLSRLRTVTRRYQRVDSFITEIAENDLFYPHPIKKLSARAGGGLRDDALELAVARIQTCAGQQTVVYSADFGQHNEEIGMFITFLPKCKFAENEHLSPPPAQETELTDGRRTSGRSSGELAIARISRSRRPHRCRFARPLIPQFSHFSVRKLYIL
jgi:hypothetical protein